MTLFPAVGGWRNDGLGWLRETCEGRLIDLVATEKNNWVISDRCTVTECNSVIAFVLTASEEGTEYYVKSISMVVFVLQGPVDYELVSSREKKEHFKSC